MVTQNGDFFFPDIVQWGYLKEPGGGSPEKSPEKKNRYFTELVTIKFGKYR